VYEYVHKCAARARIIASRSSLEIERRRRCARTSVVAQLTIVSSLTPAPSPLVLRSHHRPCIFSESLVHEYIYYISNLYRKGRVSLSSRQHVPPLHHTTPGFGGVRKYLVRTTYRMFVDFQPFE
jgi:hypothetical protein